jgi:hypothetical protein
MKALASLLILIGFVLVADRVDTITTAGDDQYQLNYESYCATRVVRAGKLWRVWLTNGERVEFTESSRLRLDYNRPCE